MMKRSTSLTAGGRVKQWRQDSTRPIQVTDDEVREFELAMDDYKERSGRLFPTCSELLEVIREIGYEKRIWRPVGPWAPIRSRALDLKKPDEGWGEGEVTGWFSRVETQSGK